jgi:GT2 family glycosyltransferase
MSNIKTTIIIVNYNVTEEIRDSLNSIFTFIKHEFEVIVVDNNSPDRNIESLKYLFPDVKFHFLRENLGFAKANNYAVNYSVGEYLVFLNPDTILIEDFITPIKSYMEKHPIAGVCGPVLLNKDKSFQNSTGIELGYIYEIAEAFMLIGVLRKIYNIWFRNKVNQHVPFEIKWLSGACMVVPKKVFCESGEFNSEFFLNYEDIDFCQRVRESGFKIISFPDLRCIHLDQKSQTKDLTKYIINRYQGRLVYSNYHYKYFKRIVIRLLHIAGIIIRILVTGVYYSGIESSDRAEGYKKSLELYLHGN